MTDFVVVWSGRGPLPGQADDDPHWCQRERPVFPRCRDFLSEKERRHIAQRAAPAARFNGTGTTRTPSTPQ